mmetsp:Transcript_4635/g.12671  ORF Transcript_4635/g.12671 Transcript_4635/m.12671 type:complete len:213 (+) Transcript_4635:601-1239(+)
MAQPDQLSPRLAAPGLKTCPAPLSYQVQQCFAKAQPPQPPQARQARSTPRFPASLSWARPLLLTAPLLVRAAAPSQHHQNGEQLPQLSVRLPFLQDTCIMEPAWLQGSGGCIIWMAFHTSLVCSLAGGRAQAMLRRKPQLHWTRLLRSWPAPLGCRPQPARTPLLHPCTRLCCLAQRWAWMGRTKGEVVRGTQVRMRRSRATRPSWKWGRGL